VAAEHAIVRHYSVVLRDRVDLISHEAMGLAVHGGRVVGAVRLDQAEHLAGGLVDQYRK
jgi:hypothetical protein